MGTLLLILLLLMLFGAFPIYPYSRGYTWYPASGLGLVLLILLILILLGHVPW
jgi:hypothetical protein